MKDLPTIIEKWGKAILVSAGVVGLTMTFVRAASNKINAGTEAKAHANVLEVRVKRLERQSRFVVRGIESLTRKKYRPASGETWDTGEDE